MTKRSKEWSARRERVLRTGRAFDGELLTKLTVRLPLGLIKRLKRDVIQEGFCVQGKIRALLENHIEYANRAPLPDPQMMGERAYLAPWEDKERERRERAKVVKAA